MAGGGPRPCVCSVRRPHLLAVRVDKCSLVAEKPEKASGKNPRFVFVCLFVCLTFVFLFSCFPLYNFLDRMLNFFNHRQLYLSPEKLGSPDAEQLSQLHGETVPSAASFSESRPKFVSCASVTSGPASCSLQLLLPSESVTCLLSCLFLFPFPLECTF